MSRKTAESAESHGTVECDMKSELGFGIMCGLHGKAHLIRIHANLVCEAICLYKG